MDNVKKKRVDDFCKIEDQVADIITKTLSKELSKIDWVGYSQDNMIP